MKMPHRLLLSALLSLACVSAAAQQPLSSFDKFRSYPYMDRAYREAGNENWAETERLTRHLLTAVPENQEARALLIRALVEQGRYADAETEAASGPLDNRQQAILELRLARIRQAPPEPALVDRWRSETEGNDRVRLWQAYSLSLGKHRGAEQALRWLNTVTARGDDLVLRTARANWAEQLRDWDTTIEQLAPLAASGNLSNEDWRRLANAYAQNLDEQALEQLLQSSPSPTETLNAQRTIAARAIALGDTTAAKRWLQPLLDSQQATPQQRQQLWELARQSNDVPLTLQLSEQLQRPCLETVDWLSQRDPQRARSQLPQCSAQQDPHTWLILAQRLHADELLESTHLPAPWDEKRRDILLQIRLAEGKSQEVMAWLARQPQTLAVIRQRAELSQKYGQPLAAADLWQRYYQQSGDLAALDQASYLALKNGHEAQARDLLERAFDRHGHRLPRVLRQRLADVYSRAGSQIDIERTGALLASLPEASRGQLFVQLAETGHCDLVQQRINPDHASALELRALGRCSLAAQPGAAVIHYQSALDKGDRDARLPLAYALSAAGDPQAALQIWSSVPASQLDDTARLTAAANALAIGDAIAAERHWQQAAHHSADSWALGASIATARQDLSEALQRQRQALQHQPTAAHFHAAATTAQQAGETEQSTQWLAEAVRLEPGNPRFAADYGMRLAAADTPQQRRAAIAYLQRASRAYPEDYRLGETLAWRYDEVADSASARHELRRVIDLEQNPVAGDDENGSLEARRFRQRRAHQVLSQRDSFTVASIWSPAGVSSNDLIRSDGSSDSRRRARSQNLQMFIWDHALGAEPSRNGSTVSVYGRVLMGGEGRDHYGRTLATGLGLRYKPFGRANLNLYAELYKQNSVDEDTFDGVHLHELISADKIIRNHRRDGRTSSDFLLRATASFLDQGDYRNDWRVDERDWSERFLYLDAAWWTHAGDHQWVSRYQQGHTWKLPTHSAQTLMPYGFLEFAAQDPANAWRQDLRSGIGLRWQYWFNDDRYNAYRSRLTVRTEYQWGMAGNLYEQANGWLLGMEMNF